MYESSCSPPFCDFVFCDWQPNDRSSPQDSASLQIESFVEPTHPLSNWSRRNIQNFMSHIGSTNKGKVLRASEENIQTFKWAFATALVIEGTKMFPYDEDVDYDEDDGDRVYPIIIYRLFLWNPSWGNGVTCILLYAFALP